MIAKPRLVPLDQPTDPDTAPSHQGGPHISQAVDTLARTLWGEARGEGRHGMEAVAAVIMNRVAIADRRGGRYWWGAHVVAVCRRPWQFSCWNANDPNRRQLEAVTEQDPVFATALTVARHAINGLLTDPTAPAGEFGATHYHARGITPHWAIGKRPVATIGRHIFFRLVDG
ncbi:MAG: cell wall hydrolase [Pseudomonadota bacterium]